MHHIGEEILVHYSRAGKEGSINLKAEKARDNYSLVKGEQFDRTPQYLPAEPAKPLYAPS